MENEEPQAKKPKGDHYGPSSSLKDTAKPADPNRSSTAEIAFCNGCGVTHAFFKGSAGGKVCRFLYMKHPDYNSEDKPWAESTKGKAYAAKKLKCLSESMRLEKGEIVAWERPPRTSNPTGRGSGDRNYAGMVNSITYADINTPKVLDKVVLPVLLSTRESTTRLKAEALLDPGATKKPNH